MHMVCVYMVDIHDMMHDVHVCVVCMLNVYVCLCGIIV